MAAEAAVEEMAAELTKDEMAADAAKAAKGQMATAEPDDSIPNHYVSADRE